jgi:hypothetical protein
VRVTAWAARNAKGEEEEGTDDPVTQLECSLLDMDSTVISIHVDSGRSDRTWVDRGLESDFRL